VGFLIKTERALFLAPELPQFDADAMAQLQSMGFPELRCQKALLTMGNNGADVTLMWLLEHAEDPGERENVST
jgi:ubiquitin carboxyl-terminal hydrolase 5/13